MANDLLTRAIHQVGLTNAELADIAQVDPKTVERWLSGRIPHPRYRSIIVNQLGVSEEELWPEAARLRRRGSIDEISGAWPRRDDKDAPDWRAMLRGAESQVDLIGYSLLTIIEAKGAIRAISAKAAGGCSVRIAVADPDSQQVLDAELLHRGASRLTDRVRQSHERLLELVGQPNVEIRVHRVATSHTILRFDDQMLLTVHIAGTPGLHAPLLHLRRDRDYGIFDQFVRHIEEIWHAARLLTAPGTPEPEPQPGPASTGAEQLLGRFDDVWRPGH